MGWRLNPPTQLVSEDFVVAAGADVFANKTEFAGGAADFDLVAVEHGDHDLAVDGEADQVVLVPSFGFDEEGDLAVGGNHDGAHGKFGGADGCENKGVDARVDDGAAGRERVSGGAGGRGDDHPVGFERNHLSLVHLGAEGNESSKVPLIDHGVV